MSHTARLFEWDREPLFLCVLKKADNADNEGEIVKNTIGTDFYCVIPPILKIPLLIVNVCAHFLTELLE